MQTVGINADLVLWSMLSVPNKTNTKPLHPVCRIRIWIWSDPELFAGSKFKSLLKKGVVRLLRF
jgi:hypothetical protein